MVEDDGREFDPAAERQEAWGLRMISYRADLIRAEVDVQSRVGEGTRVVYRVRV